MRAAVVALRPLRQHATPGLYQEARSNMQPTPKPMQLSNGTTCSCCTQSSLQHMQLATYDVQLATNTPHAACKTQHDIVAYSALCAPQLLASRAAVQPAIAESISCAVHRQLHRHVACCIACCISAPSAHRWRHCTLARNAGPGLTGLSGSGIARQPRPRGTAHRFMVQSVPP